MACFLGARGYFVLLRRASGPHPTVPFSYRIPGTASFFIAWTKEVVTRYFRESRGGSGVTFCVVVILVRSIEKYMKRQGAEELIPM